VHFSGGRSLAGADHSGDSRGLRHGGNHAPRRGVEALCMALARAVQREGVTGLLRDKTRKLGLPPFPPALVERVVPLTLAEPLGEAAGWPARAMAAATGVSLRSVQRIWAAHCLHPHRVRRFKLVQYPAFAAKCAMSYGSISTRRATVWFARSTRSRKFRRSTAHSQVCRSRGAGPGR